MIKMAYLFFLLFQICFRHSCRTKLIGSLNRKLTDEQKSFIRGTPFGWMVELKESVTYLDVCIGLGLRVVGENIDLNQEGLNSDLRNLFGASKVVEIEMVYDYILKHIKVLCLEDFGKLYVLLAISEFLLPNRSGIVFFYFVQHC